MYFITTFRFQFHKGTIRTAEYRDHTQVPFIFQFHKGTIRTSTNARTLIHISYFNSIKVRLELLRQEHACVYEVFQFHKGTIRTTTTRTRLCI